MSYLKLFVTLPLVALILYGCGASGFSFKINGSFSDMKAGQLFIYSTDNEVGRFDTIMIKNGKFAYSGRAEEPTAYILVFPNAMEQVIFVNGGEELEYEATANDLKNYVVNGSEENKLMNKFRQETYKLDANATAEVAKNYIKEHAESVVATYLFDRYFVQETRDDKDVMSLLQELKKKQPKNLYLLNIEGQMKVRGNGKIGKTVPDIDLLVKGKEKAKLYSYKKDYTLIVFWASWMRDYYETMDLLTSDKIKNNKRDKLDILTFSLDTELYKFEEAQNDDSLSFVNCCDLKSWNSPVVRQLGVGTLPYYILMDKNHKVLTVGSDINKLAGDINKYVE